MNTAAVRQHSASSRGLLIDGTWVGATGGQTFEVRDPSSDQVIARCALGEAADINKAVDSKTERGLGSRSAAMV
jgi:acyl-CoA reductase-like NAD-dependent aldehyde dehydrogenase